MAAFCACCGAKIILKAEACPVCGAPQHGMAQPDLLLALDVDTDTISLGSLQERFRGAGVPEKRR
jgi:RNA polymerase subunit RPABC4/transcription elongation factor Spt4